MQPGRHWVAAPVRRELRRAGGCLGDADDAVAHAHEETHEQCGLEGGREAEAQLEDHAAPQPQLDHRPPAQAIGEHAERVTRDQPVTWGGSLFTCRVAAERVV